MRENENAGAEGPAHAHARDVLEKYLRVRAEIARLRAKMARYRNFMRGYLASRANGEAIIVGYRIRWVRVSQRVMLRSQTPKEIWERYAVPREYEKMLVSRPPRKNKKKEE